MLSFEEALKEAEMLQEKIENIILEEMEEKSTECVDSIQAVTSVKSGNLKRSMTHEEVERVPEGFSVKIGSPLEYAQAVEEGHTQEVGKYIPAIGKRLVKSYVPGRHMIGDNITIYQKELEDSIIKNIKVVFNE